MDDHELGAHARYDVGEDVTRIDVRYDLEIRSARERCGQPQADQGTPITDNYARRCARTARTAAATHTE
jgi:hypothetical protein